MDGGGTAAERRFLALRDDKRPAEVIREPAS
jgi:hypothetical protein